VTPTELLRSLYRQGANVRVDGEALRVRAPAGVITEAIREEITALKPDLIKVLSTYPCSSCGRFAFSQPNKVCYWCLNPKGRAA
jgi:hypothetical protein